MLTTTTAKHSVRARTKQRIRESATGLVIFNGGEETATLVHQAMPYQFPPCANGSDGLFEVRNQYGVSAQAVVAIRDAVKKGQKKYSDLDRDVLIATADDIAEHAERKLRHRGIVVLTGDPEQDEILMTEAKANWVAYRLERAQAAIDGYRKRTASFYADPRNVRDGVPPRMTAFERGEQAWLDKYDAGDIDKSKYVCRFNCGFDHDDEATMDRHEKVRHAASIRAEQSARTERPIVDTADDREAIRDMAEAEPAVRRRGPNKRKAVTEAA